MFVYNCKVQGSKFGQMTVKEKQSILAMFRGCRHVANVNYYQRISGSSGGMRPVGRF